MVLWIVISIPAYVQGCAGHGRQGEPWVCDESYPFMPEHL